MTDRPADWQSRPEAGTTLGLRFLVWVARHLGRGVLHAVLWPVSVYFLVRRGPERRAALAYLERVLGRTATWRDSLRHFHCFATVAADRVYFLAGEGHRIPVSFVIDPAFEAILKGDQPGIVLAAHFGSFEAARILGPQLGGVRLRIVLDKAVNARFMSVMDDVEPEFSRLIIDAGSDSVALGLAIADALKAGDWIGFLADRWRTGDRVAAHSFLGRTAWFPQGPFLIASVFRSPIICVFCRLVGRGYEIHTEVLRPEFNVDRRQRAAAIEAAMADYVRRLERHVQASPHAWFNFYDFWAPPPAEISRNAKP